MTDSTPAIITTYLAQLDAELVDLPVDLRRDIVAGVREELHGLDAAAAAVRIQELGDPAFIAAEARSAAPVRDPREGAESPSPGQTFSIVAVVVLIAGSLLVPALGALAGLVFVSQARAWSLREKVAAWLLPAGVVLLALAAGALLASAGVGGSHLALLAGYLVFPLEGIVLAVRARSRGWRPAIARGANRGGAAPYAAVR